MSCANSSPAASMSPASIAARRRSAVAISPASLMLVPLVVTGASLLRSVGLAPHLHRHLVHRQRDRRLGLGRLDPHAFELVVGQQPVGDGAAQALERAVRALL